MDVKIVKMKNQEFKEAELHLDFKDADADLIAALRAGKDDVFSIYCDDQMVGAAQVKCGKKAYLYVFIDARYRTKGIGTRALYLCEQLVNKEETKEIVTSYQSNDASAKSLAAKFGYSRKFATTFMKYSGESFDTQQLSVRSYCDDDYDCAHAMYAAAFHEMRVSVGDFPESVIEEPSEKMREFWSKTKNERLVFTQNDEIVGYARVVGNEVASVSVKSDYQGRGIGRHFVKYLCNKILSEGYTSVDLFCVVGNRAKALYDSLGFVEVYTADIAEKRHER